MLISVISSPLGPLVAGATSEGVCLLEFADRPILEEQMATTRRLFGATIHQGSNEHLENLQRELESYFAGSLESFSVPLLHPGTEFQQRVWGQLLKIPYGETLSYEELATALGQPRAVRAVGHANGLNRIAIVIPCHRVVNKNGDLGGYGGGLQRKRFLLELEGLYRAQPDLFTAADESIDSVASLRTAGA